VEYVNVRERPKKGKKRKGGKGRKEREEKGGGGVKSEYKKVKAR